RQWHEWIGLQKALQYGVVFSAPHVHEARFIVVVVSGVTDPRGGGRGGRVLREGRVRSIRVAPGTPWVIRGPILDYALIVGHDLGRTLSVRIKELPSRTAGRIPRAVKATGHLSDRAVSERDIVHPVGGGSNALLHCAEVQDFSPRHGCRW